MSKWADYLISAVRYDPTHNYISDLMVRQDSEDSVGPSSIWTRNQVVSSIERGYTFVSIYKRRDGKWYKGEDVRVIEIDGVKYLRTDSNHTKQDNLGELPEF